MAASIPNSLPQQPIVLQSWMNDAKNTMETFQLRAREELGPLSRKASIHASCIGGLALTGLAALVAGVAMLVFPVLIPAAIVSFTAVPILLAVGGAVLVGIAILIKEKISQKVFEQALNKQALINEYDQHLKLFQEDADALTTHLEPYKDTEATDSIDLYRMYAYEKQSKAKLAELTEKEAEAAEAVKKCQKNDPEADAAQAIELLNQVTHLRMDYAHAELNKAQAQLGFGDFCRSRGFTEQVADPVIEQE